MRTMNDGYTAHAEALDDRELLDAWRASDGEPGDPEADALLAELVRRNLDF
jgi:hypothetical protein